MAGLMARAWITRARVLKMGAGAVAGGAGGVLAACGASGAPTSEQPPAAAKRPATLIVDNDWTKGDRLTVVQAWLQRANQVYPHLKTELRDNAESNDKTIALFAADQQGDLFQLHWSLLPVYGTKNALQDIGPTLAALKFDVNSLYDVPDQTLWNGKRLGLLIQLNTHTGVYNKNALQEAGMKEPAPSWTWDDYLEMAKRLHRPVDNRWGVGLEEAWIFPFFWAADAPYLDPKGPKALWDTPKCREVLQWLTDLVVRHRVAPSPKERSDQKLSFYNGNYGMHEFIVPTPAITKRLEGKFAWEVLPRPKHPRTKKAVYLVTGHGYYVTAKAKERGVLTEAVQVLTELFHKDIQNLYISGLDLSSLPILKSVATSPQALQQLPSSHKYALDNIPGGRAYDQVIGFKDFQNAFVPEFRKALDGEVSLEQAVANMQRASDAALQQAAR
jgi:multiple sugar transport system substrate-binding protein